MRAILCRCGCGAVLDVPGCGVDPAPRCGMFERESLADMRAHLRRYRATGETWPIRLDEAIVRRTALAGEDA